METLSRQLVRTVSCPKCSADCDVALPPERSDAALVVRPYRGLVGDYVKTECAAGHAFFVYLC